MDTPAHQREEELYQQAVQLASPEEREAFLAGACGGDDVLLGRVRELLVCDAEAADQRFLPMAAAGGSDRGADSGSREWEQPGAVIGVYKLREQIGEGGFGTVWVADQEQPVRRRVALKIIKMGMDTKEVIARFEQERQALAMMDHPNIAKVLDAGATQSGRPFFVMELVRGVKITEFCDDQQLSTAERLALFITVCHAVQHAHQKGIIHRDLKPSNIFVTINDGVAVPKVIDFGVAKATQGRLTDRTVYTQFQQMLGTPLYMSPEQTQMTSLDIDTRSDIYSLGVLLYELLTGHTPIEMATMAAAGMDEIRRMIRDVDPPRPSMRMKTFDGAEMTTAAKRRNTDVAKLPGALRGDLDWIVMKCIEKDRKRRYDTANSLALDLQRHLAHEAVTARPPTAGYLLGKLIRRNKLAFAAGGAIAASLVIGIAASVWQAVRANAALEELRATAPAFVEQARGLVAKERFDEALDKLAYAAKLRPDAPEYLIARGDLLQCQLRLAEAAAAYRAALTLRPGEARAEAGAALCDELLAAPAGDDGKLTRESLSKLHLAMQQQQRSAAELMPVARLLGEEKTLIVAYWLERLKELPISADKPLAKRLTFRDDGLLALDLSDTKVADLAPLAGAPLAVLNASGAGELTSVAALRGMSLIELNLARTKVADLSPLRDMRTLEKLLLNLTPVSDLSPLLGLRLRNVDLTACPVSDISPLRSAALEEFNVRETRVTDLSPLTDMPLKFLDLAAVPVIDFKPLAGLPLERCNFAGCQMTDLAVVRRMPLRELMLWGCASARNYAVLGEMKTLELLILPETYRQLPEDELTAIASLRSHPGLRQLGSDAMRGMDSSTTGPKDVFWRDFDREQSWFLALRKSGFRFSLSRLPAGTYALSILNQPLSDLSMLKGAPVSSLNLTGCHVADLTPIHDLPLEFLRLSANPIANLNPLRGLHLETLDLHGTKVSDISVLAGMPLKALFVGACENVTDVSTLAGIPTLERVTVPMQARNIEMLRKLPKLHMLGFRQAENSHSSIPPTTADEFWKQWAGLSWARALNEAGMKYTASQVSVGIWQVSVVAKHFSDCSIFKDAPIRELTLNGTSVADLRPLAELALTKLALNQTPVTDLTPLRAPALSGSLRAIYLLSVPATDFSPLTACANLEVFWAPDTALADLSIVRGRKLRILGLGRTRVTDISVLAGMPLTEVYLDGTPVTDVSPLLQCPTLKELLLPAGARDVGALRALTALTVLSYEARIEGKRQRAAEFWKEFDAAKK